MGREEPRSEGGDLRLRVQPRNIRDPGHGEHVGHLHDQQGGQHVPQTDPGPLWLECSQHCLQHKGWTVACDDAVISCQPSPCYGELGNGDKKSSAAPCIVDTLDGLYIMKVGAGPAHTLYIARNSTEKEKEILAKLPVLDQAHLED